MKKSVLFSTILLIAIFAFSLSWVISNNKTPEREAPKFDHRIDNVNFWVNMAKKGYTPFNPDVKTKPAVFTGSKIKAFSVLTEDSPDIPVTEINSTQSENSIFVDPLDNNTVLQSNNSTPNPVSGIYGANDFYSFDVAETWEGEVEGAGGNNSGDPTTAIGLNGRWYVNYISNPGGQGIAYSDDKGESWLTQIVAPNPGSLADKNHMWIDNSIDSPYEGNLYVGWTDFGGSENGNVVMNMSSDDGVTWSPNKNISGDISGFHQGIHFQTGPEGEVYGFYSSYGSGDGMDAIGMSRSFDGGETWEASKIITNIRGIREFGKLKTVRVNDFPVSAVDISNGATRGNIYVVWANIGVPGTNIGDDLDVYMIRSADQGETWSEPIRVNQDPIDQGNIHYFPWITCDPVTSSLSVVFYDDRNVSETETEVFCANSPDAGETWEDFKVSDVAFTPSPISGLASNYFGDYLGITARAGKVYPVWTDNRLGYAMTFCSPYDYNALAFPKYLDGEITFETGATDLEWTFDESEAEGFLNFNIYRDGELIGTATDTVYTDMLPDYGYYNYAVTALYEEEKESSGAGLSLQWGDAHISVSPTSVYEHLTVDSMTTQYIKVVNTGQLDLLYDVSTFMEEGRSVDEYCTASSASVDEYIQKVTFGEIDNQSGATNYTDFTALSTNIQFGEVVELTVVNGNGYNDDQCGAWIDWNQNEIFDEELITFDGSPGKGPYIAQVTPPLGAITGTTRMRVRLMYTGDLNPCGSSTWGEVEDYTVNVLGWLDINPIYDTVHPGDSSMIAITFDATDVEPGIYNATAAFFSNDPDVDQVDVPLTLQVSETLVNATVKNNIDDICAETPTQLMAIPHGAAGGLTYSWTSDPEGFVSAEQSPDIAPGESTWFFVNMDDGRATYSDSIYINVRPLPVVNIADTSFCGDAEILLDAGNDGFEYGWSTGEDTQTITIDSTTLYDGYGEREIGVIVYGYNKCVTNKIITVDAVNCTGIDEFSDNVAVQIYPNPNNGQFNIEINASVEEIVDVYIINQLGAVVFSKNNVGLKEKQTILINLEQNASGVYQLFIKGKNGLINKKVIKN